jgi:hypothetical protein
MVLWMVFVDELTVEKIVWCGVVIFSLIVITGFLGDRDHCGRTLYTS